MSVASRVAAGLFLVAGGGAARRPDEQSAAGKRPGPAKVRPVPGERSAAPAVRAEPGVAGGRLVLPESPVPVLAELFASHPRDGAATGFLLARLGSARPLLWVQERMAMLEAGRIHPPALGPVDLIHVAARDARDVLWSMEEGLRCAALGAVIGELWGDPHCLDFTATRRLALAAERHGVAAWLLRLGGSAGLSGARMRWRIASRPSLGHPFDPQAPGPAVWDVELFRARGAPPGRWAVAHDRQARAADRFDLVASAGDRAPGADQRRRSFA